MNRLTRAAIAAVLILGILGLSGWAGQASIQAASPAAIWQDETPDPYGSPTTNQGWTIPLPGTSYYCGWETVGIPGAFCADGDAYLAIVTNAQTAVVTSDGTTYVWHLDGTHYVVQSD